MNDDQYTREQWLKDTEEYFNRVKTYNATVMSVGYATFFAALLFINEKTTSPLVFWALLCLVASAAIFVAYELFANIKLAIDASKIGQEGQRTFRYWASFFVPSLLFGLLGLSMLVVLILCHVSA